MFSILFSLKIGVKSGRFLPTKRGHVRGDEVAEEVEKQSGALLGLQPHVLLELRHLHVHRLHQHHRRKLLSLSRHFAKLVYLI